MYWIKFIPLSILILSSYSLFAQERDTILNTMISKPFFYNVLKDGDGKIFAGTSEGIFEIEGTELLLYKKEKGYVTLNKKGTPVINTEGIKNYYERKYNYLLPYPDQGRDEYHAGNEKMFYVCSGGRMHMFDIVPYAYSYANKSIRTISENFVGTYSGIFYKDQQLKKPFPSYTEGYIREFNGRIFLCFGGLLMIEPQTVLTASNEPSPNVSKLINDGASIYTYDIHKSSINNHYYTSSQNAFFQLDTTLLQITQIHKSRIGKNDLCIIGDYYNRFIYFSDEQHLIGYIPGSKNTDTIASLPEVIIGGITDTRHTYLISRSALYVVNSDRTVEKLTVIDKAHTILKISTTELVISSDFGLYLFNTVSKQLSVLIYGVEFNRRALFLKNEKLFAGSINGLYKIDIHDFDELINRNKVIIKHNKLPLYFKISGILICIISLVILFVLIRTKRKLKTLTQKVEEFTIDTLDRSKIEAFIDENLATASLKSINEHFNTNTTLIYSILSPDKPGSIIQAKRLELVKEMKKAGKSLQEISTITGLSISYLRKIKAD